MSRIGILQPVYLPWAGYFEQIALTDTFVFLDDVQYTKQDWRNRNKIKTPNGPVWLTIPIKKMPLDTQINEIQVNYNNHWVSKHLKSVQINYNKAPYFDLIYTIFEKILLSKYDKLSDITIELIIRFSEFMGINTNFLRSSELDAIESEDRNDRLIKISQMLSADAIYLGESSANYAVISDYENHNISLSFQNYLHPTYPQLYGEFISHMCIIDLLMNTGKSAKDIILSSNQ